MKLKRKSCCCGADEKTPCVCMMKGVMKCSMSEPKCECYALIEKQKKALRKMVRII